MRVWQRFRLLIIIGISTQRLLQKNYPQNDKNVGFVYWGHVLQLFIKLYLKYDVMDCSR